VQVESFEDGASVPGTLGKNGACSLG